MGSGPPPGRSLVALVVADTADLTIALLLSWATEMLGDRPFLRAGSHGVFRPQPDGLIQLDGLANKLGATAFLELAPWLCPSLLQRPPGTGSGSRRPAARRRPASPICAP